jgi:hypothetical protein
VFLVWARDLEDLPPQLVLPCARFVLLLAYDADAKAVRLVETLEHLLDAGCVYLCTWGAGCEHVHDMMDEVIVGRDLDDPHDGTIMTTWHDKQSVIEAVDFALMWAKPDENYREGCDAIVVATIGDATAPDELRACLTSRIRDNA